MEKRQGSVHSISLFICFLATRPPLRVTRVCVLSEAGGALDEEMTSRLSGKLGALEQLRTLLQGNEEVSIPGVVVAGAQSAGKSSVLEALGGFKLPRGQSITTRCPLILSLVAIPGAEHHAVIGGTADLSSSGKVVEIDAISASIEELTTELAGDGFAVSDKPIYLKVIRPLGPTLTLIDLPGITHNSADGDQDIHAETVNLVKRFIENENMVILVVVPAMDDFANAEAIALAKKCDPEGRRTLGVVTKTDNVQVGCGIKSKLRMEAGHVQLSLGFIAVINRTPIEVEEDTPAKEVRAREKAFFTTNAEVAGLEKEYWGLDTLVERIVTIQAERVEQFIPRFVAQSKRRIKELRQALDGLPKVLSSDNEMWQAFHKVVSTIGEELKDLLTSGVGHGRGINAQETSTTAAVIPHVTGMYREYAAEMRKEVVPDFFTEEYFEKARDAFNRVDGMTLPNMLGERVFDALFREVFSAKFVRRSQDLVEDVRSFMEEILGALCDRACAGHPVLLNELKTRLVEEFLDVQEAAAKSAVKGIIDAEIGWVFTQDDFFEETVRNVHNMVDTVRQGEISANLKAKPPRAGDLGGVPGTFIYKMVGCPAMSKEDTVHGLQVTIHAYSDVVCRRLFDTVPKQIHLLLVNGISTGIVSWMLDKVDASDLQRWFAEGAQLRLRRKELERKLSQFEESMVILKSADGVLE